MTEQRETTRYREPEQYYPVHQTWFQGFLDGNITWPQNNFGIHLFTLSAVLNDPPDNWQEFEQSVFSHEQETLLGRVMSGAHKARGIPVVTEEFSIDGEVVVPRRRLQALWRAAQSFVYADLLNGIEDDISWEWNVTFSAPVTLNSYNTKKIQDFFDSDERSDRRKTMIEIATAAADYLRSKEALELATLYRDELIQSRTTFSPPAVEIRKEVKQTITEFLSQRYPNETFDWLIWGI